MLLSGVLLAMKTLAHVGDIGGSREQRQPVQDCGPLADDPRELRAYLAGAARARFENRLEWFVAGVLVGGVIVYLMGRL